MSAASVAPVRVDGGYQALAEAGHELRTPITIIRGHLELLGENVEPAELNATIALVIDELDRLGAMVDGLSMLATAELPPALDLERLEVDEVIGQLREKVGALARRDWRVSCRSAGTVVADRQRLIQAVLELATNAIRHTGDGDRIEVGAAGSAATLRLWVRDFGPGIAEVDHDRIFERYVRGPNSAGRGSGLGLPIVRAIAEAHGGHVELVSRPGGGAKFTVVLPCPSTVPCTPVSTIGRPAPR